MIAAHAAGAAVVDHANDHPGRYDEHHEVDTPRQLGDRMQALAPPHLVVLRVDREELALEADVAEGTLDLGRPRVRGLRGTDDRDRARREQRREVVPGRRRERDRLTPAPWKRSSRHAIAALRPCSWVMRRKSSRAGRFAVSISTSSSVLAAIAARNPATSHTRFTARFVVAITNGSFFAISFASASVASSSSAAGTTRFTMPMRMASSALTRSSPVNSSSARRTLTTHGRNIDTTPEPKRMST